MTPLTTDRISARLLPIADDAAVRALKRRGGAKAPRGKQARGVAARKRRQGSGHEAWRRESADREASIVAE